MSQTQIQIQPAQTTTDIRSTIDAFETSIREVISNLTSYSLEKPRSYKRACELSVSFVEFIQSNSDRIHTELVLTSNVLEDCLRTIFIVNEDATLEGFATELETQLGQLRLLAEGLKELPGECNDQLIEMFSGWNDRMFSVIESREKYLKMTESPFFPPNTFDDPKDSVDVLKTLSLYNASYFIFRSYLKTFQESCVKILSVLSMVAGKWERKIEERVSDELIQEGMVMTAGREIRSRRKGRKTKVSDLYF